MGFFRWAAEDLANCVNTLPSADWVEMIGPLVAGQKLTRILSACLGVSTLILSLFINFLTRTLNRCSLAGVAATLAHFAASQPDQLS